MIADFLKGGLAILALCGLIGCASKAPAPPADPAITAAKAEVYRAIAAEIAGDLSAAAGPIPAPVFPPLPIEPRPLSLSDSANGPAGASAENAASPVRRAGERGGQAMPFFRRNARPPATEDEPEVTPLLTMP